MPRIKDADKVNSEEFSFVIRPQKDDCYYQQPIRAKFSGESSKGAAHQNKKCYEGPVYNRDRASTSPAFILRSEKVGIG